MSWCGTVLSERSVPRSPINVSRADVGTWWEEIAPARNRRNTPRRVRVTWADRFHVDVEGYVFRDGRWVRGGRASRIRRAMFRESERAWRQLTDLEIEEVLRG